MVVALIATVLILGIAFYQILQGLFSAMIMTILTILSAALAFSYYEPLAGLMYDKLTNYAEPLCLVLLFIVSLGILRLIFDKFLGGNVVVGTWPDRIVGGFFGLITGMIVIGVVLVAIQMLPIGPSVYTYRPFDGSLQRRQRAQIFRPDDFTLGLLKQLSAGSLSDERSFQEAHDNLLLETFCTRNTADKHGRIDAPTDSLRVIDAYEVDSVAFAAIHSPDNVKALPSNPLLDKHVIDKIVIVRVMVMKSAAHEETRWWRLPATHFRLVTDKSHSHYPVAHLTHWAVTDRGVPRPVQEGWQCHVPPIKEGQPQLTELIVQRSAEDANSVTADWVYRLPADEKPDYLVFRRSAKAEVPPPKKEIPPTEGAGAHRYRSADE